MANKKADIYTGTGDEGITGLFGGSRVDKDSTRVEAYGTIDELNALLGVIKTTAPHERILALLCEWQDLFHDINAEIASDEKGRSQLKRTMAEEDVQRLESLIDEFDAELPPLDHFIVPAIKPSAAFLNQARTICRRAERRLWALNRQEALNPHLIKFFNRLSDLLFTLMRWEGRSEL
ncbi:cob(I)yrinic acid a,c-diamide adenosyltransferase [Planctomycetota bacterium]